MGSSRWLPLQNGRVAGRALSASSVFAPSKGSGGSVENFADQVHGGVRVQGREAPHGIAFPLGRRDEGAVLPVQRLKRARSARLRNVLANLLAIV